MGKGVLAKDIHKCSPHKQKQASPAYETSQPSASRKQRKFAIHPRIVSGKMEYDFCSLFCFIVQKLA
ncbi:hypothetical protein NDK47_20495 [Brevibacillus ruminantium]|uniref:Uncharacterized protein n=1 Tax=Brevibacillus ruminantium TaxID=2950604 RepID=A0ABY4WBF1_9BACL|nr:hypothetical protein [Brevibacillus ruminantium]USG64506.1 hypothetical protein NDK47_20495 [Brevibacillus ruminantium]